MKKLSMIALIFIFTLVTHIGLVTATEEVQDLDEIGSTITGEDIRFYKTISDNPEQERKVAVIEHEEAIKIIEEYIKVNEIQINNDINDFDYQQFVLSLGTAFDEFNEKDMEKIISFVQFIDLYENHYKNDNLKQYKNKLNKRDILSEEEIVDLRGLLPVFSDDISTEDNTEVSMNESVSENTILPAAVYANGYNNIAARDYAYKWWNGRNPLYDYYAMKKGCKVTSKSCWSKWDDCASFVSQALYAGGMKMKYGPSYTHSTSWSYGVVPSYTWGGAHSFYLHWKKRAGVASSVSSLKVGDAVNADFKKDGDIDHTAIITKSTGSTSNKKYLTQHTSDKKETTTLANWYNSGYKVYGYEINKASN